MMKVCEQVRASPLPPSSSGRHVLSSSTVFSSVAAHARPLLFPARTSEIPAGERLASEGGCSLPAPRSVLGWRAGHPSAAHLATVSGPSSKPGRDTLACPWGPPADRSGMDGPGLLGRRREEEFVASKNVFGGVPTLL